MGELHPNTYLYRNSSVIPGHNMGAFHGNVTFLLFNVPGIKPDFAVAVNIADLWTRFAKREIQAAG